MIALPPYNGYFAKVRYEPDDKVFHGTVINISDMIHFESESVDGLYLAFTRSVDDYLKFCAKRGEEPLR